MIDLVEAFETATLSLLVPSSTPTHVKPVPTVFPSVPTYERVGEAGTKTLWVVFVIMLLSTIAFTWMAFKVPVQKRLFYVLTAFITTFAAISYFAMATGDGNSYARAVVKTKHNRTPDLTEPVFRQVFWARYIDWSLTTPLLLLDLSFLAGLNGANILVATFADVIMVLLGLFAAFGKTYGQKWGYYAIACIAYLVVAYQLVIPGRRAVVTKGPSTARTFDSIGGFTLILWTFYPIVWGIGNGARRWSVDSEIIAYAVLDILAKPVFGFWLLFAHAKNAATLDGFWSRGLSGESLIHFDDDEGA